MTLEELERTRLMAITPAAALQVLQEAWGQAAPARGTFYRHLQNGSLWFEPLRVGERWLIPVRPFLAGLRGKQ